jgi:hypothetical protein
MEMTGAGPDNFRRQRTRPRDHAGHQQFCGRTPNDAIHVQHPRFGGAIHPDLGAPPAGFFIFDVEPIQTIGVLEHRQIDVPLSERERDTATLDELRQTPEITTLDHIEMIIRQVCVDLINIRKWAPNRYCDLIDNLIFI